MSANNDGSSFFKPMISQDLNSLKGQANVMGHASLHYDISKIDLVIAPMVVIRTGRVAR